MSKRTCNAPRQFALFLLPIRPLPDPGSSVCRSSSYSAGIRAEVGVLQGGLMSHRLAQTLPGPSVPQARRFIRRTAQQTFSVGRKYNRAHFHFVTHLDRTGAARLNVPDLDCIVVRGGHQPQTIRTKLSVSHLLHLAQWLAY